MSEDNLMTCPMMTDEPFLDSAIMAHRYVCFDDWQRQLHIFCDEIYLWTL